MTDRDVQLAIFNAIAQTYAALAGEPLRVTISTADGTIEIVGPQGSSCCPAGPTASA